MMRVTITITIDVTVSILTVATVGRGTATSVTRKTIVAKFRRRWCVFGRLVTLPYPRILCIVWWLFTGWWRISGGLNSRRWRVFYILITWLASWLWRWRVFYRTWGVTWWRRGFWRGVTRGWWGFNWVIVTGWWGIFDGIICWCSISGSSIRTLSGLLDSLVLGRPMSRLLLDLVIPLYTLDGSFVPLSSIEKRQYLVLDICIE